MITYPNQKVLHINKGNYTENYLTIGIAEWADASKNLSPNTFKLYLYIASNANGFDLALSRQAVMNMLGISKDSYIRGVKELEDKHYIVQKKGNVYDFHTTPMYADVHTTEDDDSDKNDVMYAETHTDSMQDCIHDVCTDATSMYADEHTEINKTNKQNKINNMASDEALGADAPLTANAVPYYKRKKDTEEKKDKWFVKNSYQDSIFGSWIFSDSRVMEIIKETYIENDYSFTTEDIICDERFENIRPELILEYVSDVLDKEFKNNNGDNE